MESLFNYQHGVINDLLDVYNLRISFLIFFLFVFIKMKNQRWWYYQCQWCSGSWVRSGKCWKTFCRGYLPLLCTHHTDAVFVFVQILYDKYAVFAFVHPSYGCRICICTFSNMKKIMFTKTSWAAYCCWGKFYKNSLQLNLNFFTIVR